MNFEYITYSIPNSAGQALIEDDYMRNSTIAFPDTDQLKTVRHLISSEMKMRRCIMSCGEK